MFNRSEQHIELLRATIAFEHASLRSILLLNGGAAIAALTFAGNSSAREVNFYIGAAFAIWLIGLLFFGLSTQLSYSSQFHFLKALRRSEDAEDFKNESFSSPEDKAAAIATKRSESKCHDTKGWTFRRWAHVGTAASLGCFLIGSVLAMFWLFSTPNQSGAAVEERLTSTNQVTIPD